MRPLAVAAALLLAAVATARADVISSTQYFNAVPYSPDSGIPIQPTIPGFDPALGNLNSVSVSIAGSAALDLFFENQNPSEVQLDNYVDFSLPGDPQSVMTGTSFVYARGSQSISFGVNETFTTTADLDVYSSDTELEDLVSFSLYALQTAPSGLTDENGAFTGDLTVSYNYTPIPEPASIILLAGGLLGLVGIRRPRQRAAVGRLPLMQAEG